MMCSKCLGNGFDNPYDHFMRGQQKRSCPNCKGTGHISLLRWIIEKVRRG